MASLRRNMRAFAAAWLLFQIDCRMGRVCEGPMAALFALLSNHGILPDSTAITPNVDVRRVSTV